jgi:hypothetical protein
MMRNLRFYLGFVMLLPLALSFTDKPVLGESHVSQIKRSCHDIGRILRGSAVGLPEGSILCEEDENIKPVGITIISCHVNNRIYSLYKDTKLSTICSLTAERSSQQNCRIIMCRTRGTDDREQKLLYPLGSVISISRPRFNWETVPQATDYIVKVEGNGVNWSVEVPSVSLSYPLGQPSMQPGDAYKVTIIANKDDIPITSNTFSLILISETDLQQLTAIVRDISELHLSEDEKAIELNTAYMSQYLLSDAVELLNKRVDKGSKNPAVYRILAEDYLEVGLVYNAKKACETATALAKKNEDKEELTKIEMELKNLSLNPTSN